MLTVMALLLLARHLAPVCFVLNKELRNKNEGRVGKERKERTLFCFWS